MVNTMTNEERLAVRKRVQDKSKEIGHCVCKPDITCPCEDFIKNDICRCAGEGGGWRNKK